MIYALEIRRVGDHEDDWFVWMRGSLDEVLSDFYYNRDQDAGCLALRITLTLDR